MERNGSRSHVRVAVINDDTDFLRLMAEVLSDGGYDVDLMRTFENTHDRVRESQPDVVICDIVMRLEERRAALERQGTRAVAKPFDLPTLLGTVEDAVAGRTGNVRM